MINRKSKNHNKTCNESANMPLPTKYMEELPYIKEIRASWIANKSHCDENSPSKRDSYIKKNIRFDEQWLGEIGFLRFYLFHLDNNYVPGKSQIQRIDDDKGFSPDNCKVIDKPKRKAKTKKSNNIMDSIPMSFSKGKEVVPISIINNMLFTSDENKLELVKYLLIALGVNYKLEECPNDIILLNDTSKKGASYKTKTYKGSRCQEI